MTWNVEPLGDAHAIDAFDCGNDILSNWLRTHAHHAVRQGTRTYVVVDEGNQVVGYFSLAPHVCKAPAEMRTGAC